MTAIVAVESIGKRYGSVEALRELTLQVQAGEILALVGHNGAGKTTLMKLILGLIAPTQGRVWIDGHDPRGAHGAAARQRIGFLPESVAFPEAMSGREIIAFYCRLKGEPPAASSALLERVGLGAAARQRVGTYSKGMRQRLGLAQALIGRPRLLLLDEPTTGLDPALRLEFYAMLDELRGKGIAVMLSSHALAEIEARADRFALLGRGRLLACDGFAALLKRMAMPLRVRLRVQACTTQRVLDAVGGIAEIEARVPDRLVLRCPSTAKMELLARIGRLTEVVQDIEIEQPRLETIYQTLLVREQEERQ